MNSILSPTHPIYLPLVLFLAIYLWNEPTDASTGVARTTSGESFTGEIRTTAAGASVQPKTGSEHAIPLAELQMLRFQSVESPQVTPTGEEKSHLRIFTFPLRHFEGSPTTRLSSLSEWEGKPTKLSATEGSIAFDGILVPWASGKYQFFLQSQGLARAWVQGQLVGSILATNELRESSTEIFLKSEQRYSFLVEFDPAADTSSLKLEWSGPGIPRGPIPEGRLLHNPKTSTRTELAKGLLATYYGNPDQSNPRLIRIDRSVDFNWRTNAPYPDAGVFSKFSATWSGEFEVPETASYRFGIEMEGGVKLYAAGERIYERFEDMEMSPFGIGAFPITIEAGKRHKIRVEFFNSVARASLKVGFWSQENSKAPVLADRLYPHSPPYLAVPDRTNAMTPSKVAVPEV